MPMAETRARLLTAAARAHLDGLAARRDAGPDATDEDCPYPFSGEWAGESIPELFGIPTGADWEQYFADRFGEDMDTVLDTLESAYADGWVSGGR